MNTDVLIIGAGPTGLALACQLIRYGIDFVIIDKKETTTPYSKAIGVQARTLEIYEQIGLADRLIAIGQIAEKVRMFAGGKVRAEAEFKDLGKGLSPYPYILIVEQGKHERLLYEHIRANGQDVAWRAELVSFQQDQTGVTALVQQDGAKQTLQAKYMVACDGAKSLVRHSLGLKFEGSTFERMFYVADVQLDWDFGHDALQVFLMRNSLLAFFPMLGEKRYRIVGTFPEEFSKDEGDVLYDEIEEQIKQDTELERIDMSYVNWFATYKVHTRHVDKFSVGRIFLAGDSAHIHSPAGAQGMNTGIQDGYNLAWKLALVLRGKASGELLNTYNEERLPNAEQLTKTTDRFFGLVASPEPLLAFTRIYIFPYIAQFLFSLDVFKKFVFPRVSQIQINYEDDTLSEQHGSFVIKAGDRMPWFEVEGASIYDRLRQPKFHLVIFFDGTDVSPIVEGSLMEWEGLIDSTVIPLYPSIAEIFGKRESFFIILRPDNYIGLISDDFSPDEVRGYLALVSR